MKGEIYHKHSKVYYKAKSLKSELDEVNVVFEKCRKHFLSQVSEKKIERSSISLKKAVNHLKKELGKVSEEEDRPCLAPLKKLYRKIMLKAHPDKLVLERDENIIETYSDACSKAMNAMEGNDWYLLYDAAISIGIQDVDLEEDHIEMLKEKCKKIEAEIFKVKRTIPWIWFHSSDEVKEKCLKQYLSI